MTENQPLAVALLALLVAVSGCAGIGGSEASEPTTQTLEVPNESGQNPQKEFVEFEGTEQSTETRPIAADDLSERIKRASGADRVRSESTDSGFVVLVHRDTTDMSELGRVMKSTFEAVYLANKKANVGTVKLTITWKAAPPRQYTINQTMLRKVESGEWESDEFEMKVAMTAEPINRTEWNE